MCSCFQCPQLSELVHFLLWELSMTFYIFHWHRVLVDCVNLICSLYSWWESFGSSSLATLPLGFNCGFISTSTCGSSTGFATEAALEDLCLPLWGPGMEVVQLLGSQWFWQHQVLRVVGGWGSRKYSALEGYDNQYWPMPSSILAWRIPLPGREAWQATVYKTAKSRTWPKWLCQHRS